MLPTLVKLVLFIFFVYFVYPRRFATMYYDYILFEDLVNELAVTNVNNHHGIKCPLVVDGLDNGITEYISGWDTDRQPSTSDRRTLLPGGRWEPFDCMSQHAVAVIVPYRNRANHLKKFLQHMHPFLQKQKLKYQIVVVEQSGNGAFNRGKLMNVGYRESDALGCFIFHDVDLLPQNSANVYGCTSRGPRHASSAVNTLRYQLLYVGLFGGVVAFTGDQYRQINGFSNAYDGWGGEDDDLYERTQRYSLPVMRYEPRISRYAMLPHTKAVPSESRLEKLHSGWKRFDIDGLSNLNYSILRREERSLYTWVLVEI